MKQTVDAPFPQAMEGIEIMAPTPAAARKRRTAKVAPTPADAHAATDPVIEYGTSSLAVAYATLKEYVAPSPYRHLCGTSSRDRVLRRFHLPLPMQRLFL